MRPGVELEYNLNTAVYYSSYVLLGMITFPFTFIILATCMPLDMLGEEKLPNRQGELRASDWQLSWRLRNAVSLMIRVLQCCGKKNEQQEKHIG